MEVRAWMAIIDLEVETLMNIMEVRAWMAIMDMEVETLMNIMEVRAWTAIMDMEVETPMNIMEAILKLEACHRWTLLAKKALWIIIMTVEAEVDQDLEKTKIRE